MNCHIEEGTLLYDSVLFRLIYNGLGEVFPHQLCALDYFLSGLIIILILVNGLLLGAALFVWGERRLVGRAQNRVGPNRWGPFGLLQPIADLVKLITKEDLIPATADRLAFTAVPIVMLVPLILVLAVIPIGWNTSLADLNVGILYILAVTSLSTLGVFMAGWASGNRYALFGAMRGVAMLISYEVPVVLSLVGVVLIAGSMRMSDVVGAQELPFLVVQPLGMLVFVMGISAELNRSPSTSWRRSRSSSPASTPSTVASSSCLFRPRSSAGSWQLQPSWRPFSWVAGPVPSCRSSWVPSGSC